MSLPGWKPEGQAALCYSPEKPAKLEKAIKIKLLFKVSGKSPKCSEPMKKHLLKEIYENSVRTLNHDPFSPLPPAPCSAQSAQLGRSPLGECGQEDELPLPSATREGLLYLI